MNTYCPSEAPVNGVGGTVRIEYAVAIVWSGYGDTKRRSWTFATEGKARAKVQELLRHGMRPEYVWLTQNVETSLPLSADNEGEATK